MAKIELGLGLGDLLGQLVDAQLGVAESTLGLILLAIGYYYFSYRMPTGREFGGGTVTARATKSEYEKWRASLLAGGRASDIYASLLARALDWLDRFYGDGNRPSGAGYATLTGPSLDRSLAIALVYPIVTLIIVWYITGISGPLEQALGMPNLVADPLRRLLSGASLIGVVGACWWSLSSPVGQRLVMWHLMMRWTVGGVAMLGALHSAIAFAGSEAVVVTLAVAVAFAFVILSAGSVAIALAVAVAFAVSAAVGVASAGEFPDTEAAARALAIASIDSGLAAGAVAVAFASAAAFLLYRLLTQALLIWLLPLFCLALLVLIVGAVHWMPQWIDMSQRPNWTLLVFLGALPIINALFDWFSLGITRFLLRRGQGKTGLQPVLYAALDLLTAAIMLAGVMLVSLAYVQLMNIAAGFVIVDVDALLKTLRTDPGNPTVWWIYATIFTTMIPSLVNLFLGGLAIVRGVPRLTPWIAKTLLPEDPRALTLHTRFLASAALTGQAAVAGFGALVVGWCGWWIVSSGLTLIGLGLLPMAETINALIKTL